MQVVSGPLAGRPVYTSSRAHSSSGEPNMRLLRFVRRHPIILLGLFAGAFIVWVWQASVSPPPPADFSNPGNLSSVKIDVPDADWVPPPRNLPRPPGVGEKEKAKPQDTVQ